MKLALQYDSDLSLSKNLSAFCYAGFERFGRGAIVFAVDPAFECPVSYMVEDGFARFPGAEKVLAAVRTYDPERECIIAFLLDEEWSFERSSSKNPDNGPRIALEEIRVGVFLNKLNNK